MSPDVMLSYLNGFTTAVVTSSLEGDQQSRVCSINHVTFIHNNTLDNMTSFFYHSLLFYIEWKNKDRVMCLAYN